MAVLGFVVKEMRLLYNAVISVEEMETRKE